MRSTGMSILARGSALAICLMMGVSCGKLTGKKNSSQSEPSFGNGAVQGVLRNAVTGERIAINNGDRHHGIYAIIKGEFLAARTRVNANDPELANADQTVLGEFHIVGLPTDVEFPIVVNVPGYQFSEYRAFVASSVEQRTDSAEVADIQLAHPLIEVDIALYPVASEAEGVEILVENSLKMPIANALVTVAPSSSADDLTSSPSASDTRALPQNGYFRGNTARTPVIYGTTNDKGVFSISGNKLVLGWTYSVKVVPPDLRQNEVGESFEVVHRTADFGVADSEEEHRNQKKITVTLKSEIQSQK